MAAMGQEPTDEELFDMIAEVDSDGSGEIGAPPDSAGKGRCLTSPRLRLADFSEFLKVISSQKTKTAGMDDESDTGAAGPHCTPCPFHSCTELWALHSARLQQLALTRSGCAAQWMRSSRWVVDRTRAARSPLTSCAQ